MSEVEGELKKQLRIKSCRFSEHGGNWVSLTQTKNVLDEAKKEFPCTQKICVDCQASIYCVTPWFKKWFGGGKVEV